MSSAPLRWGQGSQRSWLTSERNVFPSWRDFCSSLTQWGWLPVGQGRWPGYAGLSAGQGTGGGRLTLGSRGVKGPEEPAQLDGGGEAGADFRGSGVLCAAPGLGQRSTVQATEQGRPLRPVALGPLDVYVRKANLGPDLAAFTKSAPMGRGPDVNRRPADGPRDARRTAGAKACRRRQTRPEPRLRGEWRPRRRLAGRALLLFKRPFRENEKASHRPGEDIRKRHV